MATCCGCNKELGFRSGSHTLFDSQDILICDKCFNQIGEPVNTYYLHLKNNRTTAICSSYENAIKAITNAPSMPNKYFLLSFLESYQKEHISAEQQLAAKKENEKQQEIALAEEKRQQEIALAEEKRKQKINPQYEYTSHYLYDSKSGCIEQEKLNAVLTQYAAKGWRLISVTTNELGHNSSSYGFGGYSSGTNATIDVMILIFERLVQPAANS